MMDVFLIAAGVIVLSPTSLENDVWILRFTLCFSEWVQPSVSLSLLSLKHSLHCLPHVSPSACLNGVTQTHTTCSDGFFEAHLRRQTKHTRQLNTRLLIQTRSSEPSPVLCRHKPAEGLRLVWMSLKHWTYTTTGTLWPESDDWRRLISQIMRNRVPV